MPNATVQSLSSKSGLSVGEVETKWNAAKAAAHKQYPDLTEEDDKFWAIVTTIAKKMVGLKESDDTKLQFEVGDFVLVKGIQGKVKIAQIVNSNQIRGIMQIGDHRRITFSIGDIIKTVKESFLDLCESELSKLPVVESDEKFIKDAIKHEGALRKHFGVGADEKIPVDKARAELEKLQKKASGDAKLTPDELQLLQQLNLFLKVLK